MEEIRICGFLFYKICFLQTVEKFLFCLRRGTFLKKVPKKLQVGSVGKKKY